MASSQKKYGIVELTISLTQGVFSVDAYSVHGNPPVPVGKPDFTHSGDISDAERQFLRTLLRTIIKNFGNGNAIDMP